MDYLTEYLMDRPISLFSIITVAILALAWLVMPNME